MRKMQQIESFLILRFTQLICLPWFFPFFACVLRSANNAGLNEPLDMEWGTLSCLGTNSDEVNESFPQLESIKVALQNIQTKPRTP